MILYLLIMFVDLICGLPFIWQRNEVDRRAIAVIILVTMMFEIVGIVALIVGRVVSKKSKEANHD